MEKEVRGYFSSRISFGPQGKMVNHISLRPCLLGMHTQNISSSTHHIESLNACMEH
jgi:hypothetical protein